MTHFKTDYRNAPGVKKLGLKNARAIADAKNKELVVMAEDANGQTVCLNRDEALETVFLPTPDEIEERKRECRFLFPMAQRSRELSDVQDAMTIPFIVQAERNMPNRLGRSEY